MQYKNSLSCPRCKQTMSASFLEHFQDECLQKSSVSKLSNKVAIFQDQTYVCARCLNTFTKEKWYNHQKKIRTHCPGFNDHQQRQLRILNQHQHPERMPAQSISKRPLSQGRQRLNQKRQAQLALQNRFLCASLFQDRYNQSQRIIHSKQIDEDDTTQLILLNLLVAKSKIPLLDWVRTNRKIKSVYLQCFFERFIQKSFRKLWEKIRVPTLQMLSEQASLKWERFLKDPEDIFNQEIILNSVKDMSSRKRNSILASLNKIYKHVYDDIFPKFTVKPIKLSQKRNELPLRTKDFFKLLEQLFATKEKDLVHIGIDLYLIFQSAQKIASNKEAITIALVQLFNDRKENSIKCQLEIKKGTGKVEKIVLSQQLCQLLQLFSWKGFYKGGNLYQRMRKIFGFPAYSMKKCIQTELQLQKSRYSKIQTQKLTILSGKQSFFGYEKDSAQMNEKVVKDELRIPNLIVCPITRGQLLHFLGEPLYQQKHARIRQDWLQRLKKKLHYYDKELVDYCNDASRHQLGQKSQIMIDQFSQKEDKHIQNEGEIIKQRQLNKIFVNDQDEEEKVQILGVEYSFKNNKFKFDELFAKGSIRYCQSCDLQFFDRSQSGRICKICRGHYHQKCLPKFCICVSEPCYFPQRGIPSNYALQKDSLKLEMPIEYLQCKNQKMLDQIIFLLAALRFQYTTTAIIKKQLSINQQLVRKSNAIGVKLPKYEQYQKGSYFPPLFLRFNGQKAESNSGFGLFAADDIPKNCFIGEYAADLLSGTNAIQIRRIYSVFNLVQGVRPSDSILIAPSDRCGYACLIKRVQQQKVNCCIRKVEIDGYLRAIIYTTQEIKKGTELGYNYISAQEILLKERASQMYSRSLLYPPGAAAK